MCWHLRWSCKASAEWTIQTHLILDGRMVLEAKHVVKREFLTVWLSPAPPALLQESLAVCHSLHSCTSSSIMG